VLHSDAPYNPAFDPLVADGNTDFEPPGNKDTNPNYHEYWNGSDPWTKSPVPNPSFLGGPGCYYWGEGDGDGYLQSQDLTTLQNKILSLPANYSGVIPNNSNTQDIDADTFIAGNDMSMLKNMYLNIGVGRLASQATSLELVEAPATVLVGGTAHVTVAVRNYNPGPGGILYNGAFSVVFSLDGDSSTGNAVLVGGEGAFEGNRFDVSGPSGVTKEVGGRATIAILPTAAGILKLKARIPSCGGTNIGRWIDEIRLSPKITINAVDPEP